MAANPRIPPCLLFVAFAFSTMRSQADTIAEGLDNLQIGPIENVARLMDGNVPLPSGAWVFTNSNADTHDGVDSVKSTLPNRSNSRLLTSVEGPAVVSFWWKLDAPVSDQLQFSTYSDFAAIGGMQDWIQRTFEVDCGIQPMQWYFDRRSSLPIDERSAWIDSLVVTPIPNNPLLQDAVEHTDTTIHSTTWSAREGFGGALNENVAVSGPVDPGGRSAMVLEIEGPAVVRFNWGIASDSLDVSVAEFLVTDEVFGRLEGNGDLQPASFDLRPGTHCLKFRFTRGNGGSEEYEGPNEAYLDNLEVDTFGPSAALASAIERNDGVYSNSWTRTLSDSRDGVDSATVTAPEINKAYRLYVDLPDGPGLFSFWTKMNTDPGLGRLRIVLDGELIFDGTGVQPWKKTEINLKAGTNRMLEAVFFRVGDSTPSSIDGRAFLDLVSFIPGATNHQPDLAIRENGKPIRGVGIRNATGLRQIAVARPKLRRPQARFTLRIENESPTEKDRIRIRGTGNSRQFQVLFVVRENGKLLNFTSAFLSGRFSTLELSPKGRESHEIWVTRKVRSKARTHVFRATGLSTEDARKVDAVRTQVILPRR